MASKITTFLAIFLLLNLISCTLVNSCDDHNDKPKPPKPSPKPQAPKPAPKPKAPKPAPKPESPKPSPSPPPPAPKPESPKPAPKPKAACPRDTLQLQLCLNVANIIKIGSHFPEECCPLLDGLVDLDAALCLCTAIKANVLNIIHLNVPVDLTLLINQCGRSCTDKYQCSL